MPNFGTRQFRRLFAPGREDPNATEYLAPAPSGARSHHVLDKSTFSTTDDIATGDQKVVQDTDVNEIERAFQSVGNLLVCRTKLIILAGMIMN